MTKQDYEALAAFRTALRTFLRTTEENARAAGLTPQQHQLLLAVKGHPGRSWATVGEVAEALQILPHGAVGLVNRSEAAGLVRREPDPTDRRHVRVVLTEHGEELLAQLSRRNRAELALLQEAFRLPFLDPADVASGS